LNEIKADVAYFEKLRKQIDEMDSGLDRQMFEQFYLRMVWDGGKIFGLKLALEKANERIDRLERRLPVLPPR